MPRVLRLTRLPALIPLGFALWWLWQGIAALPPGWRTGIGIAGVVAIAAIAAHVLTRPPRPGDVRFRFGWRFAVAVAAEVAGLVIALNLLQANGRLDLLLPAIGIVIGLHFVGIWWSNPQPRYLWLAGAMTGLNVAALFVADPRPLSGLGSAFMLGVAVAA